MTPDIHRTVSIAEGRTLTVTLGSIVEEDVDAIVNAANGRLAHGGGVAAVISRAAGPALDRASEALVGENGSVSVSEAVVTTAGELPHKGVVHAVGPQQGEGAEEEKLTSAIASALDRVRENGWSSVAVPAVSAGTFGVSYQTCARAYVAGVQRHLEAHPDTPIREIRLCLFDPDEALLDEVERAMKEGF